MYFWDHLTEATHDLPPAELPKIELPDDSGYSSAAPQEDSKPDFSQFKLQNPPKISKNHYQGKDVWSNFGYLRINDKWVDPESQGQLYKAYYNPVEGHNAKAEFPRLDDFGVHAPRVLSEDEEDEFYKGYVFDVEDSLDGEGDPRNFRISAATFARWATGAINGDAYESRMVTPSVS